MTRDATFAGMPPSLAHILLLWSGLAYADPEGDWVVAAARRELIAAEVPMTLGGADRSSLALALAAQGASSPGLDPLLALTAPALPGEAGVALTVGGFVRVAAGDGRTQGLLGDAEPGLLSPRLGVSALAVSPWWEVKAQAQGWLDVGGGVSASAPIMAAWAGLHRGSARVGFGIEPRSLGPGRHSALLLGDDARPFPAGSAAVEGELGRLGVARAELAMGWLQRPRRDVLRPGIIVMDARWRPRPWVELGASRVGQFAGVGRPWPGLGELLLPLDPHIYGDPDQLEADSNELASLDLQLIAPLGWLHPEADHLAVYWQYGGDDLIVDDSGAVPIPRLAGVANLFGAELSAGPLVLNVEYARLMDDYFRWYTGHRVYHEGFTQDGRSLGHVNGGDSLTWWGRVGWVTPRWGAVVMTEQVRRVEVVEVLQDQVFTAMTEERRRRYGLTLMVVDPTRGRVELELTTERLLGGDFVPGADERLNRAALTWTAPLWRPTP